LIWTILRPIKNKVIFY